MRRHEKPLPRTNPSGRDVWVARWTNRHGDRKSAGTFKLKGPCRALEDEGACCAQHRIDFMYEQDAAAPRRPDTLGAYAATWTKRHPRSQRTNATNEYRLSYVLGPVTKAQTEKAQRRPGKMWMGVELEGRRLRDWPMADLRRRHANELMSLLLTDQGRALEGARGIMRTLSAMVQDAIDQDELLEVNVFKGVKVRAGDPRIVKAPRRPRVVSWEQMHRLAAAAGPWEAMLRVVSDCGLRLGELLAIHREDLKLGDVCDEVDCAFARAGGPRGPHLHVRRTAHHGMLNTGPFGTKREKLRQVNEGGRVVAVAPALEGMLRGLPRRIDSPLLFPTPMGRTWWEDNFRDDVWNPAREASGVDASPQDFRHSWVSHLRAAGVDHADLAQMAGHSVKTATTVYTHSLGRSYEIVANVVGA